MTETSRRSRNAWIVCWISSPLILYVFAIQIRTHIVTKGTLHFRWKRSFDAHIWSFRSPGITDDGPRWEMVEDLQARYLKPGMKRAEILQLLGQDDREKQTVDLWYDMGDNGRESVGFEIEFDDKERLLRSGIIRL